MYKFLRDFFCLFSILLQAYFSREVWSLDCECGKQSDFIVSMRIVGGRRAVPHSYPWMVAIQKNGRMHCGGAIITDRHVLSAGHCFKWDNKDMMEALIGLDKLDDMKNVEKRNISKVVIHERFTSTTMRDENDIAVATLDRPVSFGFTITPVCLPTRHSYEQWSATIAGWGRQGESTAPSRVLLKATVQILSDKECMESKLAEHLVPTMMCAFSKGKDGCQGDSGGPLVVYEPSGRFVQAGIVSWGIGCADSRYPGVYTRVSDYIDWIKEKSADGVVCDS